MFHFSFVYCLFALLIINTQRFVVDGEMQCYKRIIVDVAGCIAM